MCICPEFMYNYPKFIIDIIGDLCNNYTVDYQNVRKYSKCR